MPDNHELNRKFLTLEDVQLVLTISSSQAYALVRSGELRAIRVGGRRQWRVEETELEAYIVRAYKDAAKSVTPTESPLTES